MTYKCEYNNTTGTDLLKEIRKDIIELEKQMDNKLLEIFYKLNKYIKDNEVKKE